MKKATVLTAILVLGFSSQAISAITTYNNEAAFLGDAGSQIFAIDFDGLPVGTGNGVFGGQVDFDSPEATNPGSVFCNSGAMTDAGSTVALNGVGPIDGDFLTAETVHAFSLVFSSSGSPQTISIFDLGGSMLDAVVTPPGGFFGLISDDGIGSFAIVNGTFGSGDRDRFFVDDFKAYGVSEIPLPAGVWLFGSALLGLFGLRRRSAGAAA